MGDIAWSTRGRPSGSAAASSRSIGSPGHIPGARNHFYMRNLDPAGRFLPAAELRQRLTAALDGVPAGKTIAYCGSGVTAAHNLLAMEHAGLRGARLYVGSWSEWSSDDRRGVEKGPGTGPDKIAE